METKAPATILEMCDISKQYPGVQALSGVNLNVREGEIHGLVGKNGAGKSTLMAVLMGLQHPDTGTLEINGHTFTSMNPHEALQAGVALVPQHVSLMDSLTVAENILAGEMPVNRFGFVDWSRVYEDADQRLTKLGLKLDVHARVEGVGVAEQTMLAIAKALFSNAKLIILDEPTAALPRADIDRLFDFIRSLKEQHVAFIYISHHMEEVFEICDRVTIMRNGSVVATRDIDTLTMSDLVHLMVGENLKEFERATATQPEEVLVIKDLTRRGHYENINLTVRKGEVVGISGLEGSGTSSLGMALFGLERIGIGTIELKGNPFLAKDPQEAMAQGLAYLPQDRYRFGLVGLRPIRENITYTILDKLLNSIGIIDITQEKKMADQYIRDLGVVCPSQEQRVNLLSGGNQQKVVFAKLAATQPSVLVLHEPTQGIDIRAKTDIYRIVDELSSKGVGIIIISTEVRELLGVCDRILVMYEGKITHDFKAGEERTNPENILLAIEGECSHVQRQADALYTG
jgi:ABC-type sugar transport system ATPase subunit